MIARVLARLSEVDRMRLSTAWTRAFGGLTALATLLFVLAAVLLRWRPGVRPLLLGPVLAALVCGLGWLLAAWCAPAPASAAAPAAAPSGVTPPPPGQAELETAVRGRRRVLAHRAARLAAGTLLGLGSVLSLLAAFGGAPPERAARNGALVAAGARWDEYVLLGQFGDPSADYASADQARWFAPVGGPAGERLQLAATPRLTALPVGARVRILHVPGRSVPAPLTADEWQQGVEPPAVARPAALVTAGVVLLVALVVGLVGLNADDPTVAELRAFLARGPQWRRARSDHREIEVDLPPDEIVSGTDGRPDTTTETCHRLEVTGASRPAAFRGSRPDLGPGWLGWDGDTRRAVFVPDGGRLVWGRLRDRLPDVPVADAPQPGPRELVPEPGLLDLRRRGILTLLGLWCGTWTVHRLTDTTATLLSGREVFEALLLHPMVACTAAATAVAVLAAAGVGLAHLVRRFRG